MAFSYGFTDGDYIGEAVSASCFEQNNKLILDIKFRVRRDGEDWMINERGYQLTINKRHWLTNDDGGFNERTIDGLKKWATDWHPTSFDDFYWFQSPDENGVPFGHLKAVGEVRLRFLTNQDSQNCFVHPLKSGSNLSPYVPANATADKDTLASKWGSRARALFAATPKRVAATPKVATPTPTPKPMPKRKVAPPKPTTIEAVFEAFKRKCQGGYSPQKHDAIWFSLYDSVVPKDVDPDQLKSEDIAALQAKVDAM